MDNLLDSVGEIISLPTEVTNLKLFTLEYSKTQNQFHIDELSHVIKQNFGQSFDPVRTNDYKIIFIGTEQQCQEMCNQIKLAKQRVEIQPEASKPPTYSELNDVIAAVRSLHPFQYSQKMVLDSTAVSKNKLSITITYRKDRKQ